MQIIYIQSIFADSLENRRLANTNGNYRPIVVVCAVVWNSLPTDLRLLSLTAATFAKHLLVFSPGFSASEDYLFCAI